MSLTTGPYDDLCLCSLDIVACVCVCVMNRCMVVLVSNCKGILVKYQHHGVTALTTMLTMLYLTEVVPNCNSLALAHVEADTTQLFYIHCSKVKVL
jgi:hypothetical protein